MALKNFQDLTDAELEKELDRLWRSYMYYMAAEGNWSSEAKERGEVTKEYFDCVTECKNRGMEV